MALIKLSEKCKGTKVIGTLGGKQDMRVINEAGLYKLIMRSNKPIAEKFQEWVCEEVLPSIRKSGAKEKIKCECGLYVIKHAMNRHINSKIHESFLKRKD